ncbi:DUF4876 domain-containing protein [Sediminibacterium ginsengisoli]|uniref:DUF4876 domain-containing protein n=1 Tax=Sediminibacterium ginsengisoli TaxID=413434 RepID=A0A1T4KBZ2_9BACT|nr:DUF4876 domain-containing protein [Sediminibacterium ginsengisoli]SJZ39887.1 Protein of unknown function [Sediminibacterium ginsengisoli]
MKKLLLLSLAGSFLLAVSCKKKDLGGFVKPISFSVKLSYEASVSGLGLRQDSVLVKITNLTSGTVNEAYSTSTGIANFPSIPPGNYTITATVSIKAAKYTELSGTAVNEDVVFNGNATSQSLTTDQQTLDITLSAGKLGDWVFKQIYYAGSNTSRGAVFRDQFFELYNNSNQVLYADSLYFAQVFGSNVTTNNAANAGYLSNSQYDWSKSIGMTGTRANEDYVYVRSMYMIKGTGKQYPVQPGESIIIAQTALDHTKPYANNDGTTQGITDPTLTIDLSKADFEGYLVDYKRASFVPTTSSPTFSPYKWDVDNPAVPNLDVVLAISMNDMILENLGRDAYVIFKAPDSDPRKWPSYPAPVETSVTATTTLYPQVPVRYVIDAVELQRVVETQRVPKRLQNSLDAGPTNVSGGEYTSQSLVRKTARTVGGRKILKDTNNSANDFATKTKADPSKSASSFVD